MDTVYILLKRKPGLTFEQFRDHYENSHAVLGVKYFGHLFRSYKRNYIPTGLRFTNRDQAVENAYDCITELVFKDAGGHDELRRIASDPEVRRTLIEDEERFLDRGQCANAMFETIESTLPQG